MTPGDQDMGRNPNNRSGGLIGNDRTGRGSATGNGRRAARADRGLIEWRIPSPRSRPQHLEGLRVADVGSPSTARDVR